MPMPSDLRAAPPEITSIVARLIAAHFPHLTSARILLLVRENAEPSEGGQVSIAAAGVPTDEARQFDYVLWFALDAWRLMDDSDHEALVFHELMHCDRDETGDHRLKPHDSCVFNRELELYGAWWQDAQQRFKQARAAGESRTGNVTKNEWMG